MLGGIGEILLVDDNEEHCYIYGVHLACERVNVRKAYTVNQALDMIDQLGPEVNSLNIIDYYLDHGHTGVQLAIELNARGKNCTNILLTGNNTNEVKEYIKEFQTQMKLGPNNSLFVDFLQKPITGNELRDCVRKHLNVSLQNYR